MDKEELKYVENGQLIVNDFEESLIKITENIIDEDIDDEEESIDKIIYDTTHVRDEEGEIGSYCFVKELIDFYNLTEKEIIDFVKNNKNYKLVKILPSEDVEETLIIATEDCSLDKIIFDVNNFLGIDVQLEEINFESVVEEELNISSQIKERVNKELDNINVENVGKSIIADNDKFQDLTHCFQSALNNLVYFANQGQDCVLEAGTYFSDGEQIGHFRVRVGDKIYQSREFKLKPFRLLKEIEIKGGMSKEEIVNKIRSEFGSLLESILDEKIEKHKNLNQKLFDENNQMRPKVRDKILEIVDEFKNGLEEDEIKIDIKDIVLVGSNASYNYTLNSDIDVHIIVDTDKLECPDDLYSLLYSAYRSIWNKKHDIKFYGFPVELYIEEDEDEFTNSEKITESQNKLVSNGVYSILNDKWIKEPVVSEIPDIDEEKLESEVQIWEDRYFDIIENIDNCSAKDVDNFIDDIYELRKQGLEKDGEYSLENLTFKEIRNFGYLETLKELKDKLLDKTLSLTEKFKEVESENIYNYSIEHDGGIFDIKSGQVLKPKDCYSVEYYSRDWNKNLKDVNKNIVIKSLNKLHTKGLQDGCDAIGTWNSLDSADSSVGLDKIFYNKEDAVDFGHKLQQKAIAYYDNKGDYNQVNIGYFDTDNVYHAIDIKDIK